MHDALDNLYTRLYQHWPWILAVAGVLVILASIPGEGNEEQKVLGLCLAACGAGMRRRRLRRAAKQ